MKYIHLYLQWANKSNSDMLHLHCSYCAKFFEPSLETNASERTGRGTQDRLCCSVIFLFFFSSSALSLCLPLPLSPGSLDAEQTQCSLCKITRLIKANKQTTALRQLQMRGNLYTINKGEAPLISPCILHSAALLLFLHLHPLPFLLHPTLLSLSSLFQSLLCCWAGLKGKENWLTHRLFIDQPFFLPLSVCVCFSLQHSVYLQGLCQSLLRGMEKCASLV